MIQHWTLSPADLAIVERRRGDPNQLGFALQLCAFRYPGRLLWSDEAIPAPALRFVADQLGIAPGALTAYGTRPQTRREQLDALRAAFGFAMFAPEHQRALLTWLLPAALGTADTMAVAETVNRQANGVLPHFWCRPRLPDSRKPLRRLRSQAAYAGAGANRCKRIRRTRDSSLFQRDG